MQSSAEAQHVGNLNVRGDANTIRIVLLDGASYDLKGDANKVKRVTDVEETGGFFSKLRNML